MNWLNITNLHYKSKDKLFNLFLPELKFTSNKILIHGSNGIGKTTFFKLLLNQLNYQSGKLYLDTRLKKIVHIDQNLSLLDYLSTKENCLLHCKLSNKKYSQLSFDTNFNELANKFKLLPYINTPTSKLSYGQKQRASILKAIVIMPNLILADEPTSFQDYKMKEIVTKALLNYCNQNNSKLIMISHDKEIISQFNTNISFDSIINPINNSHVITTH
jgi:ABC-type lipoprotein export system ATPase subunit